MSTRKELLLHNLNQSLKSLIESHFNENNITNIKISFAAPDDEFHPDGASVNIFLYDIRENLELRNGKVSYIKKYPGQQHYVGLQDSPINVNFSYIITAWGGSGASYDTTESIISILLQILMLYTHIPEKFLVEGLKDILPLPKLQVLHPTFLQGIGEFWSALKGKPRPIIHCTVTMPIYPPEYQKPQIIKTETEAGELSRIEQSVMEYINKS